MHRLQPCLPRTVNILQQVVKKQDRPHRHTDAAGDELKRVALGLAVADF